MKHKDVRLIIDNFTTQEIDTLIQMAEIKTDLDENFYLEKRLRFCYFAFLVSYRRVFQEFEKLYSIHFFKITLTIFAILSGLLALNFSPVQPDNLPFKWLLVSGITFIVLGASDIILKFWEFPSAQILSLSTFLLGTVTFTLMIGAVNHGILLPSTSLAYLLFKIGYGLTFSTVCLLTSQLVLSFIVKLSPRLKVF